MFGVLILLFLFNFGVFCIILYCAFKRPCKYKATLISKRNEMYRNMSITTKQFLIGENENGNRFDGKIIGCYSTGDNNLIVDNVYLAEIKEIIWNIKMIKKIRRYW